MLSEHHDGGSGRCAGDFVHCPARRTISLLNVSKLGVSGAEFAERLLNEYGVAVDPGAFFKSNDHVRLPFGGEETAIEEAARRIDHFACDLAGTPATLR